MPCLNNLAPGNLICNCYILFRNSPKIIDKFSMKDRTMKNEKNYWKSIFGIEKFKIKYYLQLFIYKLFSVKLPKIKNQKKYWQDRGQVYMDEINSSGYLDREIFFQNMLFDFLRKTEFDSFFEAGCGFGWNVRRVKEEFKDVRVGGLDFSITQLQNSKKYLENNNITVVNGDNCSMPFKDNAFDIGFSLGVFMNIHPDKIKLALKEMIRVCKKNIVHVEYDESNTTDELREKRAFKTNIISHDYKLLYKELGMEIKHFYTYNDFGDQYKIHENSITTGLNRWEGFEGAEKYIFIIVEVK